MIPLTPAETTLPPLGNDTAAKDGVEAILQDHERLRSLFNAYRRTIAQDGMRSVKLAVVRDIVSAVSQHASAEERTLYPLARNKILIGPRGSQSNLLYKGLITDDQSIKLQWQYIYDAKPETDEEWNLYDRQVDLAATLEECHMGKEEEEVIARLREMLTNVEKEQLWVQWTEALRVTPPLEPHPEGPSSPLLAAIAHPIAGMVDRAGKAAEEALCRLRIGEPPEGPETVPYEETPHFKAVQEKEGKVEKEATSPAELLQG